MLASVMKGRVTRLQTFFSITFQCTIHTHCLCSFHTFSAQINNNQRVQFFFQSSVPCQHFFSESSKSNALNELRGRNRQQFLRPGGISLKVTAHSEWIHRLTVRVLREYHDDAKIRDSESVIKALKIIVFLEDFTTIFLLQLF
jgi:hypothetical protein